MACPCGSERNLEECCGPILAGQRPAETAEALMRSRYTAYATGNVDWIIDSQAPEGRAHVDRKATEEWSKRSEWLGLEIRETHQGQSEDTQGVVEFVARYRIGGEEVDHHEIAQFRKEDGRWYFVDGVEVKPRPFRRIERKVGPNEPCPCGSGRKHKKCCGRPGAAAP